MNKFVGIGLSAAAVIVAVVVGMQLLSSPDGEPNVGRGSIDPQAPLVPFVGLRAGREAGTNT